MATKKKVKRSDFGTGLVSQSAEETKKVGEEIGNNLKDFYHIDLHKLEGNFR
jgi:hypothetical protein